MLEAIAAGDRADTWGAHRGNLVYAWRGALDHRTFELLVARVEAVRDMLASGNT